uniref:DNA 5'-3' helicase n=1 Tax=Riquetophycus sp. TaxID=1897556 RepID=A0A1C9C8E9_9FLOR|nr:replication helicase subunit [Riquetophycus sp.]
MHNIYSNVLLPHNYLAEEILIGSIIINPNLLIYAIQNLDTEYLLIESHQIIYRYLIRLDTQKSINPVNITYALKKTKSLRKIGGIKKITALIKQGQIFNISNNIDFYIQQILKIIQNNYYRRLIVQYGYDIINLANNSEFSSQFVYIKALKYLNYIDSQVSNKNIDNLKDLIGDFLKNIIQVNKHILINNKLLYSGFKDLDILTNGLPKGDLIVIAGRPAMGKTSFVMNIAYHLLKYFQAQICIFSLEMTKIQILHKLISIGSGISVQDLISNQIHKYQWSSIQIVCQELLSAKIYINDNSNITTDEIGHISKTIQESNISTNTIIIDYLQLINEKTINSESRSQELSYITRKLKILAQNLKIPILILSQLNRSIDKRINKQPLLSDLKESGCISIKLFTQNIRSNNVHINTIIDNKIIMSMIYISSIKNNYQKYFSNNYIKNIYTLNHYTFRLIINQIFSIYITDNHKCLTITNWIRENQLIRCMKILQNNNTSTNTIEKTYIEKISFSNYNIVYKYRFCNFICNSIILHNSIEQDADIVMMLYKDISEVDKESIENNQIIDIIISKNRNGPVGIIKLYFNPENTSFSSISRCI